MECPLRRSLDKRDFDCLPSVLAKQFRSTYTWTTHGVVGAWFLNLTKVANSKLNDGEIIWSVDKKLVIYFIRRSGHTNKYILP